MLGDPTLAREDRSAAALYVPAILAALAAAIVGGVAWGLIVKSTDYEVGFAAWGIGFLTGFAVLTATRGARGLPLQVIAVVCALLGIVLGKYLAFVWVLQEGPDGLHISVFSRDAVDIFRNNLDLVFDWIDLVWVGFAVFSAWRTLRTEEPKPVERTETGPPAPGP